MRPTATKGFTLIELAIVVAIVAILGAIAIPHFALLIAKSQEAANKGNLGVMRSALAVYYGDTEGTWPSDPNVLAGNKKYLPSVPFVYLPRTPNSTGHAPTNAFWVYTLNGGYSTLRAPGGSSWGINPSISLSSMVFMNDHNMWGLMGGWAYDAAPLDSQNGNIQIFCAHQDLKGVAWNTY